MKILTHLDDVTLNDEGRCSFFWRATLEHAPAGTPEGKASTEQGAIEDLMKQLESRGNA